MGDRLVDI